MRIRNVKCRVRNGRNTSLRNALLKTAILACILGDISPLGNAARAEEVIAGGLSSYVSTSGSAVDGINGKVNGFGGRLANRSFYGSTGALSIPLGGWWGAQIDGAVGDFDRRTFAGVAGHLFWRDPGQALFGAYAGYMHWDRFSGVHVTQVAAEGEYYWQRWTLQGIVGAEFGNSVSSTTGSTSTTAPVGATPGIFATSTFTESYKVKSRFFDQINLKYYLTANWGAYVGHRYLGGKNALALGTEYALPLGQHMMGSAFVEGRVGEGEFHGVWGGVRFYFGGTDKTLVARHRQDDPNIWLADSLFSVVNSYSTSGSSSRTLFCDGTDILVGDTCISI